MEDVQLTDVFLRYKMMWTCGWGSFDACPLQWQQGYPVGTHYSSFGHVSQNIHDYSEGTIWKQCCGFQGIPQESMENLPAPKWQFMEQRERVDLASPAVYGWLASAAAGKGCLKRVAWTPSLVWIGWLKKMLHWGGGGAQGKVGDIILIHIYPSLRHIGAHLFNPAASWGRWQQILKAMKSTLRII